MLGPEQLNVVPRVSPVLMESIATVRVSEQLAKSLGLNDNQIIRGVIAARNGTVSLLLNNRELEWAAGKRFKEGDKIDFRVENSATGRTLKPIAVHYFQPQAVESKANSVSSRLMSLLYRPDQPSVQMSLYRPTVMGGLLSQINDPDISRSITQLLPSMANLSGSVIQQALVTSGLFGEFILSRKLASRLDIKQVMRKLLADSRVGDALKSTINQVVDEIESSQLDGLRAQQNQQLSYGFTIPFVDANPVVVRFEQNRVEENQKDADWVIDLHTDAEELGKLWSKTTIKANLQVDMIVWAARSDTAQKAEQGQPLLEKSLQQFGLNLKKLVVLNAARPNLDQSLSGPGHVLDVST